MAMSEETIKDETVQAVKDAISASTGAIIMSKSDPIWEKISTLALDIPSKFGIVPTPSQFLDEYGTTIGGVIGLPRKKLTPLQLLVMLVHEGGHVLQFNERHFSFVKDYLIYSERRAAFEAACIVQEAALMFALRGSVDLSDVDRADFLVYGYLLGNDDVRLAKELVDSSMATLQYGYVPHVGKNISSAIVAIKAIERVQPSLLNQEAMTKLRAAGVL